MTNIQPVRKLPDVLIYHPPKTNSFRMFSTRDGKTLGIMNVFHITDDELFINPLIICRQRRQGYGSKFLNFAKHLSEKLGCGGRLGVKATTLELDPHNPPHIFYRKFGFTSKDKKMIGIIDKHIRKGKQLDYRRTAPLMMYYPDDNVKQSFWQKIKNRFF